MARSGGRGAIDATEAKFLELQLHSGDATTRKNALQRLCRLHRLGQRLRTPEGTVLLVIGLLYDPDKKVVRWALNAAAFLVKADRVEAVLNAIDRNRDDPDIVGAGVAALAATNDEDRLRELLEARGLPLQGATLLAAAQKLPKLGANLTANRINIDTAPISELRLASVLVGIEKAPENMFDPNHANSEVIGALNSHPDAIVAQYSIWATMESKQLGLAHVRIPLGDVMAQRDNVRAYIYRLLASDPSAARANLDFIDEAAADPDPDARASLARGLRDTYFDGLEEVVVSWFLDEEDPKTAGYLLDHMAAQASHVPRYGELVEHEYRALAAGSPSRTRLEVAARGTSLNSTLGRIRLASDSADFFQMGVTEVTNNNSFTFNGPATGAFAGTGNASTGDISAIYRTEAPRIASEELAKLAALIDEDASIDGGVKEDVKAASQGPKKALVEKIANWLKVAKDGGQLAGAAAAAAPAILENLSKVIPHLPL